MDFRDTGNFGSELTVAFTQKFYKKYRDEVSQYSTWAGKNGINVIVEGAEDDEYPEIAFLEVINTADVEVRALVCYDVHVAARPKGLIFRNWEELYNLHTIRHSAYIELGRL